MKTKRFTEEQIISVLSGENSTPDWSESSGGYR